MRIFVFVFLFGVASLLLPSISTAEGLVPAACIDGQACQTCHFVELATNIITWLVKIMATLCALVVAFAGLKMVTAGGDPGAISEARGMITNVVVGFIILLSAWLVVDTVMKMFVNESKLFGPWNQIRCEAPPAAPPSAQVPQPGIPGTATIDHNTAKSILSTYNINVVGTAGKVQADCSNTSGCTSLDGIRRATIDEAVALKNACSCTVTITGGTEAVHANGAYSHANGYKFDAGLNPTLDSHITNNYRREGTRSDGAALYRSPSGALYAKEGNHWDVLVKEPGT